MIDGLTGTRNWRIDRARVRDTSGKGLGQYDDFLSNATYLG